MNEINKTIAEQIGNRAFFMMGAHSLTDMGADGLRFKVRGSKKANVIVVKYDEGWDLYTVRAFRARGLEFKQVGEFSQVYADNLHGILEELTGLYTSL